jgi:hypothetical protein
MVKVKGILGSVTIRYYVDVGCSDVFVSKEVELMEHFVIDFIVT